MNEPYRVAIFGPLGKLGHAVTSLLLNDKRFSLVAPVTSPSSPHIGKPLNSFFETQNTAPLIGGTENLHEDVDFFVDCSTSAHTPAIAKRALAEKTPLLLTTTGHSSSFLEKLRTISDDIPLLFAPNLSFGIAHLRSLLSHFLLPNLESITIEETHRVGKRDIPSGTALAIEEDLLSLLKQREDLLAPIISHRIDDCPGEHRVIFDLGEEQLELSHRALNRSAFAKGVIPALLFLVQKPPGLYSMKEVFSQRETCHS